MSPLRWTCKSTRTLADELQRQGFHVSCNTVRQLLRARGFSLQANRKTVDGNSTKTEMLSSFISIVE